MKTGGELLLGGTERDDFLEKVADECRDPAFYGSGSRTEFTKRTISDLLGKTGFKITSIVPTAFDTPWAGLIDVIGGISLNFYQKLLFWKWDEVKKHPEESISYFIVASK